MSLAAARVCAKVLRQQKVWPVFKELNTVWQEWCEHREVEQDGAGEEGLGPGHAALYSRSGFYSKYKGRLLKGFNDGAGKGE